MPVVAILVLIVPAFAFALLPVTAVAAEDTHVSFVACPVARDRGPSRDVCFIARRDGQDYALLNPADFGTPQLRHRILVEGKIVPGRKHCDAVLLEGRFSVLGEVDNSCNEIIPYTGPPVPRPEQELIGKVSEDPQWQHLHPSVRPVMGQVPDAEPLPGPPYAPQEQVIYFPFDSDRGSGPDMGDLVVLVDYAIAASAHMKIVAYQGTSHLDNGRTLKEKSGMAKQRADKLRTTVLGLGFKPGNLQLDWQSDPVVGDGIEDWRGRRAEIRVRP